MILRRSMLLLVLLALAVAPSRGYELEYYEVVDGFNESTYYDYGMYGQEG